MLAATAAPVLLAPAPVAAVAAAAGHPIRLAVSVLQSALWGSQAAAAGREEQEEKLLPARELSGPLRAAAAAAGLLPLPVLQPAGLVAMAGL